MTEDAWNLTPLDHESLYISQNGLCAICLLIRIRATVAFAQGFIQGGMPEHESTPHVVERLTIAWRELDTLIGMNPTFAPDAAREAQQ